MSVLMEPAVVRIYGGGALVLEEPCEMTVTNIDALVKRHIGLLTRYALHMLEIEFLDHPVEDRFIRFGTDPRAMRQPVPVTVEGLSRCR